MRKIVFKFGLIIVAVVLLLQLSKYSWRAQGLNTELVVILIALVFAAFGFVLSKYLFKTSPKTQKTTIDVKKLAKLGISKREYDVLKEMASGKSNREIADQLFISESTVKTHVSNLLGKLNAKRRTEAIRKAKEVSIL